MTARELILDVIESLVREEKRTERPVALPVFVPSEDDEIAADLACRIGITVWTERTSHGLLWAVQPMPLQRH